VHSAGAAVALHGCVKSAIGADKAKRRDTMRLITAFEVAAKKESELHALYSQIAGELAHTKPDSTERHHALASLENISREIAVRKAKPPRL
jgi:hypothetical protein